jgi:hypothetical protein
MVMNLLFATPLPADEPFVPQPPSPSFDQEEFFGQFLETFTRLAQNPEVKAKYWELVDNAYLKLEDFGKNVNADRAILQQAIRRTRLAYNHVLTSATPRSFALGETTSHGQDTGTIIEIISTVIGRFYRLQIDHEVIEIFGGLERQKD